jgi:hypothetical protein
MTPRSGKNSCKKSGEKGIPNWVPKLLNGREEWERRLKERKERDGQTPKPLITFRSDMGCQLRLEMRER